MGVEYKTFHDWWKGTSNKTRDHVTKTKDAWMSGAAAEREKFTRLTVLQASTYKELYDKYSELIKQEYDEPIIKLDYVKNPNKPGEK